MRLFLVLFLCLTMVVGAQSDPNRRLYTAVIGYELNEAAATEALAAGADINWKNSAMNNETILITAIKGFQSPKVIKFLMEHGANPALTDDSGRTALSYAQQYNIGNNADGRETLKLLGGGANNTTTARPTTTVAAQPTAAATGQPASTTGPVKAARASGPPSAQEVKAAIESNFYGVYVNHHFGVKSQVLFDWIGPITVADRTEDRRQAPAPSYAVKVRVKVTAIDPRDGHTSAVERGVEANPNREVFLFYRNSFNEWEFGIHWL